MKKISLVLFNLIFINFSCWTQTIAVKSSDGKLLLNGKQFFAKGIYHVSWFSTLEQKVADMKLIGAAGFNCVHASAGDDNVSTKAMLDAAYSAGIYVILEGQRIGISTKIDVAKVNLFKTHPALIGWSIGDDVHTSTTPADLTIVNNQIKKLDPNHLTFFTVYDSNVWNPYFGIGDYIMPYNYPIGDWGSIGLVDAYLTSARTIASKTNADMIGIPQSFSWSGMESDAPNALEYRNMVYQYLINDVNGLISYSFTDSAQTNNYLPKWKVLWQATKDLNVEVESLQEIIMNGIYTRANTGYAEGSSGNIQAAYWIYNNETYVVAINVNTSGSINASIALPNNTKGTLKPFFNDKPNGMAFNSTSKKLTGIIKAEEVHVYKISDNTTETESEYKRNYELTIYPNPAQHQVTISNAPIGTDIKLLDLQGRELITKKTSTETTELNIQALPQGLYIVKVGNSVQKLTVE